MFIYNISIIILNIVFIINCENLLIVLGKL